MSALQVAISPARSGEPTAQAGSIRIHSAYNPDREAARILEKYNAPSAHGITVVIGAGLGYIDRKLREAWPGGRVVAVHLNSRLYEKRIDKSGDVTRWHPDCGVDLEAFFSESIDDTALGDMRLIRWPASEKAWPDRAAAALQILTVQIRRRTGNISVTAAFGRLWMRNSIRNYLEIDRVAVPAARAEPVVLAAAGPSLESALGIMARHRSRYRLWALPSALPALALEGLIPDLVFATDPGHWARIHGRYFPPGVPVVMPLTAVPPPKQAGSPMLIFQDVLGEKQLFSRGCWPGLHLPEMGTVAATALAARRRLGGYPFVLVGLDLCWYDLRAHARPHPFDGWLSTHVSRRCPALTIAWERAGKFASTRLGAHRVGPSLQTYADWFRENPPGGRVCRYSPNGAVPIDVPGIPVCGDDVFTSMPLGAVEGEEVQTVAVPRNSRERRETVRMLIRRWTALLRAPQADGNEEIRNLLYTLDPGGVLELARSEKADRPAIYARHLQRVRDAVARFMPR